ncbi:hypothetical protein, partial [Pseudomonas ogarae]|uniref:hypothetical protein n=1 Tax=Pseudomonas ogarae (strain DSM 112162 / CECT 30235 / F113) TaxID=1114970 RepID=UPI00194FC68A
LKNEGILEELPDTFNLDDYKGALQDTLDNLRTLPKGPTGAAGFEEIVGNIIKLCFFRSLTNVQPHERSHDGASIRDWIASNRA